MITIQCHACGSNEKVHNDYVPGSRWICDSCWGDSMAIKEKQEPEPPPEPPKPEPPDAARWKAIAEELYEALEGYVPDRNCSCHISPPCSFCETHGLAYETMKQFKQLQRDEHRTHPIDP